MPAAPKLRAAAVAFVAAAVFLCVWLLRFNDPGGGYAGLTDDHFFYLVRGWQILFGELPVRDFVDQGAPLFYYVAAAVQVVAGRGTLTEVAFCVTVLALSAAVVFWLATEASGWMAAGLLGVAFHVQLGPRFYNYPKILVYALALPLLWRFVDQPSPRRRFWLAVITVIGFLFRHDHGVFVAAATGTMLVLLTRLSWRERVRHGVLYAVTCLALVSPYLVFVQANGGVSSYVQQTAAWAARERERTPVEWPGLFDAPEGVSDASREGHPLGRAVAVVQDNITAWTYYVELSLPVIALLLLAASSDALRPGWPWAREKLLVVAVLALVLDAGLLRSPLEARLADPSVPHAILIAWLAAALPRLLLTRTWLTPRATSFGWVLRPGAAVAGVVVGVFLWALFSQDFHRRMERVSFTDGLGAVVRRAERVAVNLRTGWALESWIDRPDRPELIGLSLYLNACTAPTDRVFVQAYIPQVLGMARRAFAGGHADLRAGFFATDEAQRLTVDRLRKQSVPIILIEVDESNGGFGTAFPIVMRYIEGSYRSAGTRRFDDRFNLSVFVERDRTPSGVYPPLQWPCFASGTVRS